MLEILLEKFLSHDFSNSYVCINICNSFYFNKNTINISEFYFVSQGLTENPSHKPSAGKQMSYLACLYSVKLHRMTQFSPFEGDSLHFYLLTHRRTVSSGVRSTE